MAGTGRHHEGADLPGDRLLGGGGGKGADAAVDQSDRQAALRDGRGGAWGIFRARTARRISDRGGASGGSLPEVMQQSQHRSVEQAANYYNEAERSQGRAARLGL